MTTAEKIYESETDDYFANPLVIEAIERGKADIEAGGVTTIADPKNIWDSIHVGAQVRLNG